MADEHKLDEITLDEPRRKAELAERARRANAEGKLGVAVGGRRPATRRPAYELAAAKAAVHGEQIAEELIKQALSHKNPDKRLTAIKLLFDMEHRVRSERREDERFAHLAGDELTHELLRTLRELTEMPEFDAEGSAEEVLDGGDQAEIFGQG
jgi:hypothetical protein